jgi:heme/copper-type cytochrome/quinol oxidase subunit 3
MYPGTNNYLAVYFTMTGLHGLHVIFGMAVNGYLTVTGKSYWDSDERQLLINRVENAGLFWHFVDIVWIFLFPVLYLL